MKYSNLNLAALSSCILLASCSDQPSSYTTIVKNKEIAVQAANVIYNFDSKPLQNSIVVDHAKYAIISQEQTDATGSKASNNNVLKVDFLSEEHHQSMLEFTAEKPWDWSQQGDFGLALDIGNPKPTSVHVYVSVKDSQGAAHNRSFVVPANSDDSYVIELAGADLNQETGIRSNPFSWKSEYTPIIWRYGSKNIDLTQVTSVSFKVIGVGEDKVLTFDNIELVKPKSIDTNYLKGLVDQFGQSNKMDFVNKVSSVEELVSISNDEQATLNDDLLSDRSKYNGWSDGPKLEATGFYRVEKYQDVWTLVDPEGYLFFSNGIANIRMANTSTITGYDFDANFIKQREPGDLTPEDSIGLNRAPEAAWPTREVSSPLRADMFTWLPKYDEPMAKHFGYRREVHTGVIDKGETYSFYQANLARKYQSDDLDIIEQKWRDTTIKRMQNWGFTSFGNWVDPNYYDMAEYPYFANGWIIGDYKTVSSGNDYWSPLPDPFDPKFKERAYATVKQISAEVKNSPWCVGVFIDNEKSWGQMGSITSQYGVAISALKLAKSESPAKRFFSQQLNKKYKDINTLNTAWNTNFNSWQVLDSGIELTEFNDKSIEDLATFLYEFGKQYFAVVNEAMDTYMPNHLYMGVRFADWGMTPEVRQAAAEEVDVVSYNYYKEVINEDFWQFLKIIDRPSIIGEFHNGSLDSGLLNPGLIHAANQEDRGKKYAEYVNSAIDNPYIIGTHWFQYIDSPLTGRALDGENYNVGFVSVTDIPYQPLVDAAKKVNKNIYTRRFGKRAASNEK
ncbi:beta-galactosidase [Colwellia sp. E2M01]|uniref:beta-galactosidase n=1 Tax=Colwellia sp. E2M01 TaxID=2841561 RepID=UPI001C09B9AC|nr:beta-galactosidase [Colwellia sp. E2M01]MBU2872088.1 beta-galactosidase [Colwellia sp. E2M01]